MCESIMAKKGSTDDVAILRDRACKRRNAYIPTKVYPLKGNLWTRQSRCKLYNETFHY